MTITHTTAIEVTAKRLESYSKEPHYVASFVATLADGRDIAFSTQPASNFSLARNIAVRLREKMFEEHL